jgi:gentisate 1,2-dioxygenase
MFFEPHPETYEPVARIDARSPMRFSWEDTRARLEAAEPDADGAYGTQIELGGPAMRTISLHMMKLAPGVVTAPHRTTANNIYAVAQGEGETVIDGERFLWSRGDVIAAPCWRPHCHRAFAAAVLLRVGDEALLAPLGLLRQERVA